MRHLRRPYPDYTTPRRKRQRVFADNLHGRLLCVRPQIEIGSLPLLL